MMYGSATVHEPEEELLTGEDAVRDATGVEAWLRARSGGDRDIPMRVSLSALLDALEQLNPEELREVARRAQERLSGVGVASP